MTNVIQWLYDIKTDKLLHFICGMLVGQAMFALFSLWIAKWGSIGLSMLVVVVIGGMKELFDRLTSGVSSWKDFVATVIGGFVGLLVMLLL